MELVDQFGNVVGEDRIVDMDEFLNAVKYYADEMTFRVYVSDTTAVITPPVSISSTSTAPHESFVSPHVTPSRFAPTPVADGAPFSARTDSTSSDPVSLPVISSPVVLSSTSASVLPPSPPQANGTSASTDLDFTSSISSLLADLSSETNHWSSVVKVPSLEEALKPLEYEVIESKYAMAHLKTSAELEFERLQEEEKARQAALELKRQEEQRERDRLLLQEQMRLEQEAARKAEQEKSEALRLQNMRQEAAHRAELSQPRSITSASSPALLTTTTAVTSPILPKKSISDRRHNIGNETTDIYALQAAASKLTTQVGRPESDDEDDAWAQEQANKARKRAQEVERKKRMEAIAAQRRNLDDDDGLTPRRLAKSSSNDKPQDIPRNMQFESSGEIVRISVRRHVAFDSPQVTFVPLNCSWDDLIKAISLAFQLPASVSITYFVLVDEEGDETSGHITDAAKFWKFYSMRYIAFDGMSFVFYENEVKKSVPPAPAAASRTIARPLRDDSDEDEEVKNELRKKAEARALERLAAQEARRKGDGANGRPHISVRTASSSSISTAATAITTPQTTPRAAPTNFKLDGKTTTIPIPENGTWQQITDAVLNGFKLAKGSTIQKLDLIDEDGDEVFGSITTAVKYWKAMNTRYTGSQCVFVVSAHVVIAPVIEEVSIMCREVSDRHVHAVSIPENASWETISACVSSVLQLGSVALEKMDLIDEDGDEVFGNIVNDKKFWKAYKTRYQGTDSVFVVTFARSAAIQTVPTASPVRPKVKSVDIQIRTTTGTEKVLQIPENSDWEHIKEVFGELGHLERLELVDADGDMMFGGITTAPKFWKSYQSRYVTEPGNVYIVHLSKNERAQQNSSKSRISAKSDASFKCRLVEERSVREVHLPLNCSWDELEKQLLRTFQLPTGASLEHITLVDEDGDDVFGTITNEAKFWKAYTSRYRPECEFVLYTKVALPQVPKVTIKCQIGKSKKLHDIAIPEKCTWDGIRSTVKEQVHIALKMFRLVDEDGDDVFSAIINETKFWKAFNTRYAPTENHFVLVEDDSHGDLTTEEDDTSYGRAKRPSHNSIGSSSHGRETVPMKRVQCTLITDPSRSKLAVDIPVAASWIEISKVLENRFALPPGSSVSNMDLVDDDGDLVLSGITADTKFWKAVNTRYGDSNMVFVVTFNMPGGLASIKMPNSIYYRGDTPRQHRTQEAYHGSAPPQRRVPTQVYQNQSDDCQSDISSHSYPMNSNSMDKSSDSMRRHRLVERPRPAPAPPMKPQKDEEIAAFLRASGEGNIDAMEHCLQMGMDINAKDNGGLTAIHVAAIMGRMNSIKWLLDQGASISSRDADHMTPLHYACESKHVDVALHLVRNGGDTSLRNKDGLTCLHYICIQGVMPLTSLIRDYMINVATSTGLTLLHCAADVGHVDIVEYLLEHGAQVQPRDDDGMTPLHLACIGSHLEVAKALIDHGSYWNLRDDAGMSPFLHACREGHFEIVQWLMTLNINMFARNDEGETALHCACQSGQMDIIKMLFDCKLDINARTKNGETPLEIASSCGHDDLASWLEDRGCHMRPESETDASFRRQVEEKGEAAARAFEAEEEINLQREYANEMGER